ncbi:ankyrin repeat domain-containing protein 26-like, partial [Neopelma chrysocephalum]|uniref:ankyrin repeat domain-containing protein 26-like n=1 Tax=Neopelma chrysocephalum TaxID=114329 RepID=UPI000FCD39EC
MAKQEAWKRMIFKVAELSQQLDRECQKCTQLEATSRGLQEELSSLRGKWGNLEKSKCQLQEELAKVRHHLESNVVDGSQIMAGLLQRRFGKGSPHICSKRWCLKRPMRDRRDGLQK